MTFKADFEMGRKDDPELERILLEKRAVIAKLRNSIINSSKKKNNISAETEEEIEFLLKRF